jgi:hypothetical protein
MSFGWLGFFRQGAWREFRRFTLNQRRDVSARITTINAELDRIGYVRVLYAQNNDNPNVMTERRIGLDVTPDTSLEKLLRAYIAAGGNPFDISMFLSPDSIEVVEGTTEASAEGVVPQTATRETQPYGGIATAATTDPVTPGLYTGGWLPLWRYPPRRFGNTVSYTAQAADMTRTIHAAREWVTQEIRTLRNDLEAKILKLMDLREQLTKERDELLPQAVGGSVPGLSWSDNGEFAVTHNLAPIVEGIDAVFYPTRLPDGRRDFEQPRISGPNPRSPMLLDDAPDGEEAWTAIG